MHVETNRTHDLGLTLYDTTETIPFNQNAYEYIVAWILQSVGNLEIHHNLLEQL